jgi:acyl-ACP thioesterase
MPISNDFTSVYTKDWEISFLQCYPNGVLKYTDLCNLLQLTAATHAEMGGISFSDMQKQHQAWVLSQMRVEIKRLPQWKECVKVKTWIKSLENSRSIRCLELYSGEEKIVGCETLWAVFNTQTRRPESLALAHDHFEKYPTLHATELPCAKINYTAPSTTVFSKKVLLSDLDIVNHANSVKYLEWCLDQVNPKHLLGQELRSLEMNYVKEVSLNDTINIRQSNSATPSQFTVETDGKTCFVLQLNFV